MVHRRKVALWLFCCAFMVVCMIVVGGFTRLSQAGLSIVEWKPIVGSIPPISQKSWEEEFNLYQQFPEYKERNFNFTLEDFKKIYMIEYLHRLIGRVTGLIFLIPFIYFLWIRILTKRDVFFLSTVLFLGACQGFMGWYMVKSGLVKNPDVSHYRLASHLMLAFLIYALLVWKGLDKFYENKKISSNVHIKHAAILLVICIFQIFLGALVAGLDAGLVYNTFPLMGYNIVPQEFYHSIRGGGFFSDPVAVQFLHRIFGVLLLIYSMYFAWSMKEKVVLSIVIFFVLSMQFLLGVLTLIYQVPISLGIMHQFGAVIVFTILLFILFSLRYVPSFKR